MEIDTGKGTPPEATQTVPQTEPTKVETPAAETVETLRQKLTEIQTKLDQTEKCLRTAHSTLTEKDRLLKERSDLNDRIGTLEEKLTIALGYIAERESGTDEDLSPEKKQGLKQKFEEIESQQKIKRQQAEFVAKVKEYQTRADALELQTDSEEYLDIKDLVVVGNFARADAKLKKLEGQKTMVAKEEPKKEETKETPEQMETRIRKKILIERGELNTETGQPSGKNTTWEKVRDAYIKDPRDPVVRRDYLEMRGKRK